MIFYIEPVASPHLFFNQILVNSLNFASWLQGQDVSMCLDNDMEEEIQYLEIILGLDQQLEVLFLQVAVQKAKGMDLYLFKLAKV